MTASTKTERDRLRLQLRQSRRALPHQVRLAAAAAAIRMMCRMLRFRRARRVAAYVGSNGELDPMPLLELAARLHKSCYLPVLHPLHKGQLWFCRWRPGDRMTRNRFGIPEPVACSSRLRTARELDLVIVPLLGFDAQCHRLGMGGGYYDRTFSFVRRFPRASRPFLLGLAHESQRVASVPTDTWDVALDAVVTERTVYRRPHAIE